MSFDWKDMLRSVAPTLATAVGGPFAGMATKALSDALLGKPDGDEDEIAAALATADPATLLKAKEADQQFKMTMRELGIKEEALHAQDRASARERETKTGDSWTPRALAALVTLGFFGVLAYLLKYGAPQNGSDVVFLMLGSLGTAWTGIIAYYFGSSAGSKAKDAMLKAAK